MASKNKPDNENPLLEDICLLYDISLNELKLCGQADENSVYEFHHNGKEYILRGGTRHSIEYVHAEIDWILHLHSLGVNVCPPVQSKNNNYLESIEFNEKDYIVVVFEKAPGKRVDTRNSDEWNSALWIKLGETMGKIHSASVKYNSKKLKYKRKAYYEEDYTHLDKYLDPIEDALIFQKFANLKQKLQQLPIEHNSYGLIHYDLHTDNFHVHNGDIYVFDWDDSFYCFFIYDLAASFHETIWDNPFDQRQAFADRLIPQFWKGYSKEFTLDRKWLEYIPEFLKWREFTTYVCMKRMYNIKNSPERLKHQLVPWIKEFRDRLLDGSQIVKIPQDLTKWFPK